MLVLYSRFLRFDILKSLCVNKIDFLFDMFSKKLVRVSETSFDLLFVKLSIFKIALTIVALLTVMVLFILHVHIFDPITEQFSGWVSSSIVAFTLSMIIVKVIAVATCLTILTVKKGAAGNLFLRIRNLKSVRFPIIIWEQLRFQFRFRRGINGRHFI